MLALSVSDCDHVQNVKACKASSNYIKNNVDFNRSNSEPIELMEPIELIEATETSSERSETSATTIEDVVVNERLRIREEMKCFEYPRWPNQSVRHLEDFTLETGGIPIRSIVIAKSRSGSTFFGDLLNSVPGTFYTYEPLFILHGKPILNENDPKAPMAVSHVKKILQCDFSGRDMKIYLNDGKRLPFFFKHNTRIWRLSEEYPQFFWTPSFQTSICRLFPMQSMKIVQLPLSIFGKLLDDLNVRIVFLIRDPRGMLNSRKPLKWCHDGFPHCSDPSTVCQDIVADYYAAELFRNKYPDRFRVVRYEDLCLNPYEMSMEILHFYGLPSMHSKVQEFLESHTKIDMGDAYSTHRNTKSTPYHWITDLSYEEIDAIQSVCTDAMALWGYQMATNVSILSGNFDPVLPFSLP
ncbi:uncharacterized protein DMENIID0001_148200 [Sergentomyia squamirostris]